MSGAPDKAYGEKLDRIAEVHIKPDAAQLIDMRVRASDMEKIAPWVLGPEVLELGAGEVMWTDKMIELFGRSHIVDGSAKLLEHARAKYGAALTTFHSFFEDFDPPGGRRFQTVVATHVLEHVHDPVRLLRKAREWIAPGGRMIIAVPNATSLHRRIGVRMGMLKTVYDFSERDHEVGHQRVYDLPKLKADVTAAGYRVIFERGFFVKILSNGQMAQFPDALIDALNDLADELPAELLANLGLVVEPI